MSCSHLLNPWNIPRPPVLPVGVYIIYVYSYIYIYMYRYSPQTLHLFSSQITQTCHTIALLGPAKKVHQILLCWIYASFIPSLKNETDRFGSISRILEILRSPSPQHIQITKKTIALNVAEIRISPIKTDLRCENSFRAPLLQIHHRQRHQPTAVSSWTEDKEDQNHLRTLAPSLHAYIFCWWVSINWSKWMNLWCIWCIWIDDTMAFPQDEMESNI